ncbi:MAG TPA: A24 family peptidase [Candidatus Eisenbacteria bacterium]|jgi:prepilin peptidase CpaA|nr:A24 family peptidase [Candidatus Eisenbacteria bacterium]
MHATQFIWILTLAMTLLAALLDWRSRRIPNWLTVPGLLSGVVVHALIAGVPGALFALKGAGLALILLLPLVALRALGAGDWKLMGAVGAFVGWQMFLFVLLGSIFASGLMAIVQVLRMGRVMETLRNMVTLVRGFFTFGLKKNPQISLDNPRLLKLPFGVAVAAATLVCFYAANFMVVR